AESLYAIAANRFQAGGVGETSLLDAERQQLQTSLDRSNAAASRFVDSATLVQALGGGIAEQAGSGNKAKKVRGAGAMN
ncbi:MAG: hypothetical protein ACLPX7_19580, partial [Xanthobacteraceae bacterium]